MGEIQVLSQETIDKIAAGEVIERPASIVKELVENSIDAGASAVTVEIRDGGISFIRITDNGEGIPAAQIPTAFLRHATSKIRNVDDLLNIGSLGFRGEALSSIAAISQVELITKTAGSLTGCRYRIEGGREVGLEEIGAPEGSTFLVRNIFYNTPARKKFLKTPASEAGGISDLMEHLALSHPEISFKFIANGQTKLHTSGNSSLRDIIYSIYGRDIASNLIPVEAASEGIRISGFLGKPVVSRGNRNFENYFVNGRYVKSSILAKAIEEGYRTYMMQHRYPFTVLRFEIDGTQLDINVHPTKMELRFADNQGIYQLVCDTVRNALSGRELIPRVAPGKEVPSEKKEQGAESNQEQRTCREKDAGKKPQERKESYPEPFELMRRSRLAEERAAYQARTDLVKQNTPASAPEKSAGGTLAELKPRTARTDPKSWAVPKMKDLNAHSEQRMPSEQSTKNQHSGKGQPSPVQSETAESGLREANDLGNKAVQMELFDERLLSRENVPEHRLIGQVFDTYWIVQFRDALYIIDQHAAHEKVMYERLTKSLQTKEFTVQQLSPPLILTLSMQEEQLLEKYAHIFREVGFEIEHFGGREYSICGVPGNFFDLTDQGLFLEMLDSLSETSGQPSADILNEKLASMACKSAVKGNHRMSAREADALIQELLSLENPYHCPHGRPTIISMTKYELEKKFKRIV